MLRPNANKKKQVRPLTSLCRTFVRNHTIIVLESMAAISLIEGEIARLKELRLNEPETEVTIANLQGIAKSTTRLQKTASEFRGGAIAECELSDVKKAIGSSLR